MDGFKSKICVDTNTCQPMSWLHAMTQQKPMRPPTAGKLDLGLRVPAQKLRPLTPTSTSNCLPPEQRRRFRSCYKEEEKIVNIPKIQSTNTMPSNWKRHLQRTLKEQLTYRTFRISSKSAEYSAVSALLEPVRITSVEQIVNPTLWSQFDQKRKDMIKSKSDDVNVLVDIGLRKTEIKSVLQYGKDFQLHPKLTKIPYNDNMSLLLHCTRNEANILSILTTGLDERVGNGGLLGKGIYFTDNPRKSMSYDNCGVIFICAVLLGDCLSMERQAISSLVREPPKMDKQKRNFNDLFFDSIVGKPGGTDNEYVIYNRSQCIPLYMVRFEKDSRLISDRYGDYGSTDYVKARNDFPSFCWRSKDGKHPMPSLRRLKTIDWPFHSNKIFDKNFKPLDYYNWCIAIKSIKRFSRFEVIEIRNLHLNKSAPAADSHDRHTNRSSDSKDLETARFKLLKQLRCVGDQNLCDKHAPSIVTCKNLGSVIGNVKWNYKAALGYAVKFNDLNVNCENAPGSKYTDIIIEGSCSLNIDSTLCHPELQNAINFEIVQNFGSTALNIDR